MNRRRYIAPERGAFDTQRFEASIFDGFRAHADWLTASEWPSLAAFNLELAGARHPISDVPLRFVEQTPALLADGLHYEQRIHQRGEIATRAASWHDLFNALIWIERLPLKAALNARQVADVSRVGQTERTRAQCALTHFDEGGALVLLRDPQLLTLWDAHDWHGLFWRERAAWSDGRARVVVLGHALLEHALAPEPLHTAKCAALLLAADAAMNADTEQTACRRVACAISDATLLNDPQELRPLPLSGIPGWHPRTSHESFYAEAPCFRPLRAGRRYPAPLGFLQHDPTTFAFDLRVGEGRNRTLIELPQPRTTHPSAAEKLGMRPRSDQAKLVVDEEIDQEPVRPDVTFPVIFPPTCEGVIAKPRIE